jgi:acetylglutamate kinase
VSGALVLKFGGELLETPEQRANIAAFVATLARTRPTVLIHGGGRAIDVELDRRGIAPRKVDGIRITDAPTLDVVVSVLGGASNTALVAALVAEDVPAVGLTGVDAGLGRAVRAAAHRSASGAQVDLELVGDPVQPDTALLDLLLANGYVPVVASLGISGGTVLNVNADVMACRIAAALGGSDLVIAGGTAGVLDAAGQPIASLDTDGIDALIASGTATAGMVAKLAACRSALEDGVASLRIVNGKVFDATHGLDQAQGTVLRAVVASGERTAAEIR